MGGATASVRDLSARIPRVPIGTVWHDEGLTPKPAETREGLWMAHKLVKPRKDDRIEQALANPDVYFKQARERAKREVAAEVEQERRRPQARRRTA